MCKHENKVLINWEYEVIGHTSEYKCNDCNEHIYEIDCPIIYAYPPKMVTLAGCEMHEEDYDVIMEKERIIKENE